MRKIVARSCAVLLFSLAACVGSLLAQQGTVPRTPSPQSFALKTPAFGNGAYIPGKYGCDIPQAQGTPMISPPLEWTNTPRGTVSFALIMHDMGADAHRVLDPTRLDVTHWLLYDIPATVTSIPEGVADGATVAGGLQGANVHDVNGYQAPCPRGGMPHYYVFDLYALDASLKLPAGASRTDLLKAMAGHTIAQSTYVGIYNH